METSNFLKYVGFYHDTVKSHYNERQGISLLFRYNDYFVIMIIHFIFANNGTRDPLVVYAAPSRPATRTSSVVAPLQRALPATRIAPT